MAKRDAPVVRDRALTIRFLVAVLLGVAGVTLRLVQKGTSALPTGQLWAWVSAALLLGCLGTALYFFLGPFRCRRCGSRIAREAAEEGRPIDYYCPRCDVVWRTGWRVPRD
jgi:hypothetical protein